MLDEKFTRQQITNIIFEEISNILEGRDGEAIPIENEHRLNENLGFSSLDLAQLVSVLDMEMEADPFDSLVSVTSIRTVEDLCNAYESFFRSNGQETSNCPDKELEAVRKRASERRDRRG